MRKTENAVFGPNHPAFPKVIQTPEVLLGVAGIIVVLVIAFNVLFTSVLASATQIEKDIETKQQELKGKEALDVLLVQLKGEADQNTTDLLSISPGEIASVKIFNFLKDLEGLSADPLNLPEPHHQVSIFHVGHVLGETPPVASGTPATPPAQAGATKNIFSSEVTPFPAPELEQLKLNVPAEQYTYKIDVRGSYVGLVNFVRKLAIHSPLVGIKGLEFKVDTEAPSVLLFRNVPAPSLLGATTSKPSITTAAASASGVSPDATPELPPLSSTSSLSSTKKANTPLVLTLTLDIFLSSGQASTLNTDASATMASDATAGTSPPPTTPPGV
jgi:Tfp pilus assembly protein PilO